MPARVRPMVKDGKEVRGYWRIEVEAGRDPKTGNRKRVVRYHHGRRTEAEDMAAMLVSELERGTYTDPSKVTVGEYLLDWLEAEEPNLAPRTYESYEMIVKRHLIPAFGHLLIRKFGAPHIVKYKTDKAKEKSARGRPFAPRTIAYHLAVLNAAMNDAIKPWRLIKENPVEEVDKPKYEKVKYHVYSDEELTNIFKTVKKERPMLYPIIMVAVNTGLRLGEVLALRWRNIDLKNKAIKVKEKVERIKKKGLVFSTPKDHSTGALALSPEVVELLKSIRWGKSGDDLVFSTSTGGPFDVSNVSKYFKKVRVKAKVAEGRFHDLRHSNATYHLDGGASFATMQEILRHKKMSTTVDTYSHPVPDRQRQAVDRLGKRIKKLDQKADTATPLRRKAGTTNVTKMSPKAGLE